jgi:hypothetical protein
MHSKDILKYGHSFFLDTLDSFPKDAFEVPGAVGYWSAKDVIAHLGSYELVLVEVLGNLLEPCPTPLTDQLKADGQGFNDQQVDVLRKGKSVEQVLKEYTSAYECSQALADRIPPGMWRQSGILPWYGAEYDLEDFIAYSYYGHKREHSGELQTFRDRLPRVG